MDLQNHPGFLGWTSEGVIAIHANWPMYPAEHGATESLFSLGQFPRGTVCSRIDSIDRCWLFLVGGLTAPADPFDPKQFHVALWEEDVKKLYDSGFIEEAAVAAGHPPMIGRRAKLYAKFGTPHAAAASADDSVENIGARIHLTNAGWRELERLLLKERSSLNSLIAQKAAPIAAIGAYDAAVREACVILETCIRQTVGSTAYGQALIEQFIAVLSTPPFIAAYNKVLRGDLRAVFKHIRNDYAHNVRVIDETQCYVLLCRISAILGSVEAARKTLERERTEHGPPNSA